MYTHAVSFKDLEESTKYTYIELSYNIWDDYAHRMIKFPPVGRLYADERACEHWDDRGRSEISQIFVTADDGGIRTIQFQYIDENGKLELSRPYGLASGPQSGFGRSKLLCHTVELEHPREYLTEISGLAEMDARVGYPTIKAIRFTTNLKEYGPYGQPVKTVSFRFELGKSRQFGGFYGSYSAHGLHRIGVYLKPKTLGVKVEKA
ncbi:PREDICTED: inactive protein RESTRICTED TEV MOVEMENT 1-like isoform X2 [Tarenaya hassleriana]|uniref:inactive protein RESTRICTED TEV MOVEMENT 1-like isoform X2 n=1 Tax=Tarenaya hassleriana TaxID=28532 RepID=UPI00053C1D72|nr:PREDICTED: inactive protein RESTRICTED TEV MOVEMENT 1-like isoform X2 [Tarenaya hassleriana]